MQHLEPGRLAAFDHDPFTDDELAHFASCAACRAEREAHVQVVALAGAARAGESDPHAPRLVSWEQISAGLRQEGMLAGSIDDDATDRADGRNEPVVVSVVGRQSITVSHGANVTTSGRRWFAQARRLAAAMALVIGGAMLGRIGVGGVAVATTGTSDALVQPVGNSDGSFGSVDEATTVLNRAQRDYERASLWLAANDTTVRNSDVYRARLAALDQMMAASRAALREAPQDPVLNQYYLAAYTAREATLQQLVGTLPVDKVIERY